MSTSRKPVIILGAGITGLQTAVLLLEAGYEVKIISEHLPQDRSLNYTSPWAGAIWGPSWQESDEEWDRDIVKYWGEMVDQRPDEAKAAGVYRSAYIKYWEYLPEGLKENDAQGLPWYSEITPVTRLPASELPSGVKVGIKFQSFCVNSPIYLAYLASRVEALGGTITRSILESSSGISGLVKDAASKLKVDVRDYVFVNAVGLAALTLVPDDKMFPTRGQSVYVEGEANNITTSIGDGGLAYVIPRRGSGYTLLGGSQEKGNWNGNPDTDLTARILKDCAKLAPEILDGNNSFKVISQQVGLRPSRVGGVRIETEQVTEGGSTVASVVHCYGHGGGGYEKSITSAKKVLGLMDGLNSGESQ